MKYIQALRREGADLGAGNISRCHSQLFNAASSDRYYSSWAKAVKAAGFNYEEVKTAGKISRRNKLTLWTRERVINEILKEGESRNLLTVYRDKLPVYSAARRRFGSWKKALEAAGYGLSKGAYKNSNQIYRLKILKQA